MTTAHKHVVHTNKMVICLAAVNLPMLGHGFASSAKVNVDHSIFDKYTRTNGNNAVIMGRKTWEALPNPLDNRLNVVISSNYKSLKLQPGVLGYPNFDEAFDALIHMPNVGSIYAIGGAQLFDAIFQHATCEKAILAELINVDKSLPMDSKLTKKAAKKAAKRAAKKIALADEAISQSMAVMSLFNMMLDEALRKPETCQESSATNDTNASDATAPSDTDTSQSSSSSSSDGSTDSEGALHDDIPPNRTIDHVTTSDSVNNDCTGNPDPIQPTETSSDGTMASSNETCETHEPREGCFGSTATDQPPTEDFEIFKDRFGLAAERLIMIPDPGNTTSRFVFAHYTKPSLPPGAMFVVNPSAF